MARGFEVIHQVIFGFWEHIDLLLIQVSVESRKHDVYFLGTCAFIHGSGH